MSRESLCREPLCREPLARLLLSGAAVAMAALGSASGASADSPCGAGYTMQPGDTLYQVTQQCRVRLPALLRANPGIDNIDDIAVGTRIHMPDEGATGDGGRGDLDAGPTVSLQPKAGAPGSPITVRGGGYTPGETVTIGSGPPESEWQPLTEATVQGDGTVEARVGIPPESEPGDDLVFVIDGAGGTAVSGTVDVVARRDPGAGEGDGSRTIEGRLEKGVECFVLETPDGETYALTGDGLDRQEGHYVRVEGEPAEMSFCMQGEQTLAVRSVTDVPPPPRDRDPARAGGVALTHDYVLGSWAAKGSTCNRPDFSIKANAAGGQVVETSLNGASRTGYVRVGDDPAFIFDGPHREMSLETRGPDGLAVMPPRDGAVSLGGETIRGDGAVFVKCAAG